MRNQPAGKRAIAADRLEEIEEHIRDVRQEIADLRSTRPEDWWGTTQRSVGRSRQDIEQDIERQTAGRTGTRARTENRPANTAKTQTAVTDREQFIARLEQDINNLERQLGDIRNRGGVDVSIRRTGGSTRSGAWSARWIALSGRSGSGQ